MNKKRNAGTKAVLSGMAWLTASRWIAMALSFLSMAVLARLLSPADFGVMAAALIVVELSSAVFEGAFGMNIVQKEDLTESQISNAFWFSTLLGLAFMLVLLALAPLIQRFFGFESLGPVLGVASLSLFFRGIGNVPGVLLKRRGAFKLMALSSLFCNLLAYILIANTMAFLGCGVWSLVVGSVAGTAFETIVNFWNARPGLRHRLSFAFLKETCTSSGYFTLTQLLNWAARTGSNTVVGKVLGAEALGFYSRGWKLLELATQATAGPMQHVLFPAFSRMQQEPEKLRRALLKALGVSLPVFGLLSTYAALHGKAIVLVALGDKWLDVVPVVRFLFLAILPQCCSKILDSAIWGKGRAGLTAAMQFFYGSAMIGAALFGAAGGPVSVAAAVTLVMFLFYFLSLFIVARIAALGKGPLFSLHLQTALIVCAVAGADLGAQQLLPASWFWLREVWGAAVSFLLFFVALQKLKTRGCGKDLFEMQTILTDVLRKKAPALFPSHRSAKESPTP